MTSARKASVMCAQPRRFQCCVISLEGFSAVSMLPLLPGLHRSCLYIFIYTLHEYTRRTLVCLIFIRCLCIFINLSDLHLQLHLCDIDDLLPLRKVRAAVSRCRSNCCQRPLKLHQNRCFYGLRD